MGRPVNANGERTRQAILDAGLQAFGEKGYFGSSLRDIATLVGVRESALYNYFSSKEALFHAILDAAAETRDEQWAAFLAEPMGDARSVLERLATRILEIFCEPQQQSLFLLMTSDGIRLAKQGKLDLVGMMTSGKAPFKGLIQKFISEGSLRPGDPDVLSMVFMSPLAAWRQLHAVDPESSVVANREQAAFARAEHGSPTQVTIVDASSTGPSAKTFVVTRSSNLPQRNGQRPRRSMQDESSRIARLENGNRLGSCHGGSGDAALDAGRAIDPGPG
jgi:AcrR family transcriptional regulator